MAQPEGFVDPLFPYHFASLIELFMVLSKLQELGMISLVLPC